MTTIIDVKRLNVSIQGHTLLQALDFQLQAGEIAAIIGANGAGKSSLLRTLCGELSHQQGEIKLFGRNPKQWPPQQLATHMAVLPQLSVLNFPFTVKDVVELGRIPHSSGRNIDHAIVNDAMAIMDIANLAEHNFMALSGGEKQRTQLARVLAQIWRAEDSSEGQRLLLLDEPIASLDLGHQQILMQAIQQFSRQGVAVLMVLHELNIASRYADTLVAMDKGNIVCSGPPQSLLSVELIQQLFGADVTLTQSATQHQAVLIQ